MTPGVPANPYARVHSHVHLARTRAPGRHAVGHTTRRHLMRLLRDLPWLVRLGLAVLAVGAVGDLAYHARPEALQPLLGLEGFRAHLVTFVGMLVMLIGVVRQGLVDQSRSLVASGGTSLHAHR